MLCLFFFSSRRRHTRWTGDWSSDVCSSDLATGFSGHTQRRRKYQPMIHDMPKIGPAYAYRCEDCASGSLRCADELERVIRWYGPENVACFIAEPVVGATMGAVPAPPGYFPRIREICDRYDVLLIADE